MAKLLETLISIIVPVYNVSTFIDRCVESVLRQTYTDWELLLVDDASTDGSDRKCDEWAQRDPRISVLHLDHGGPARARNAGIEKAQGSHLYFMDSDDWIEPHALACLINLLQRSKADIAVCGAYIDYPHRTKTVSYTKQLGTDGVLSHDEALRMIITGQLPSYLWLLLLKREVVQEPYADHPCYEDFATGYKWFTHAQCVAITAEPLYHYVQREGSILHSARRDTYLLRILQERHDYIGQHHLLDDADNRANTVRYLLKLAKDYARLPIAIDERTAFITTVRTVLMPYLPVPNTRLGLKRWLRLRTLIASVRHFVRLVNII